MATLSSIITPTNITTESNTQTLTNKTLTGAVMNGTVGATTPSTVAATTISASSTITPSQTSGIVGTTTNNNANTGSVGEYVTSSIAQASAVAAVLNTGVNITSISLTAGDWDVGGIVYYLPDGSTVYDLFIASVSTTSATLTSRDTGGQGILKAAGGFGIGISSSLPAPEIRLSLASTTTVYLVGTISFSAGAPKLYGTIRARRVR